MGAFRMMGFGGMRMRLCADLEQWKPPATPLPASVKYIALSWNGVASYVSHRDTMGRSLRASLEQFGLSIAVVELTPLSCLDRDSFERQTEDAYMQMQMAGRLGAEAVMLVSGHAGSVGFDAMVDAATRLAVLAGRVGIRVLVRNVCGSAIEQPGAVAELLSVVKSPAIGACVDNIEFQRAVANPADAVLVLSGRTSAVRLRDRRDGDVCVLGEGTGHVDATVEALRDEAFDGLVMMEPACIGVGACLFGVDA